MSDVPVWARIDNNDFALAVRVTTGPGNTRPDPYRMVNWLIEHELVSSISPYNMPQARAYLHMDEADPAVARAIRAVLEAVR